MVDQCAGAFGNQHLSAVTRARHPGSAMHVQPEIFVADEGRLARVDADAHADGAALRPWVGVERPLCRRSAGAGL